MTLLSMPAKCPRCRLPAVLAVVAFLYLALAAPLALEAQEEVQEEVRAVGAHDIRVVPINLNLGAGSAQYAVFVTDPESGEPVPDAKVVMVTSNPSSAEGENHGWAFATNSPALPERYDVNLKLDATGEWLVSVDVSSPLGADLVDVTTLEVPSVNRLTQGSWVFFGVFAIILAGIAYVWWSARRDYRRKRAAQTETP